MQELSFDKNETLDFLDGVLEATAEAILLVNLEGEIVKYNSQFQKIWNIPDKILKTRDDKTALDFIMGQLIDPEEFINIVNYLYQNNEEKSIHEIELKDGRILERFSNPHVVNGKICGRVWSFRDITTDKLTRRRRIENEERLRALFDSTDVGVFIMVDYFEDCNKKVCEIFECEKEDIIGCDPMDFSPEYQPDGRSSADSAREKINEALKGNPQKFYWQHKTLKGNLIDCEVVLKPIKLNDKNCIQAVVRDVSEEFKNRKIKTAIYKISEAVNTVEDMDAMYERIHEIIGELMPSENFYLALYDEEEGILSFPYWRDKFDDPMPPKKLGKGLTELVLRTGKDLLVDAKKDEELRNSGEVELIGEPQAIWLGIALKLEGKTIGVMVVQDYDDPNAYGEAERDVLVFVSEQIAIAIDRKRKIENLKILTEEYRQLNSTKDKFFSIIAHDLKNPFNTLLGFTDMLIEDFQQMNDDERLEYIGYIKQTSESAFSLLQNLLQWSRSQTGKISYNPQNLDLSIITQNVINLIGKNAELKKIEVINHIDSPQFIFADKDMISTVIRNLFTNSIKFTNRNGRISFSARTIKNKVEVKISDNGIGMDEKVRKSLFRIDSSSSQKGTDGEKGTGLGLILCKEFIERNGGEIWAQSEVGKGSDFIFSVPRPNLK